MQIKQSDVIQTTTTLNMILVMIARSCSRIFFEFSAQFWQQIFDQFNEVFFQFFHACGMITYSEVLAASFESDTRIIYDSKLLNLESLEVENDTGNAIHIRGNLYPRQRRSLRFHGEEYVDGPGQRNCGAA